jgi:hypothetical protein
MGTPSGGLPATQHDDAALRRASELAAAEWLCTLFPDLDMARQFWRGEIDRDAQPAGSPAPHRNRAP